MEILWKAFERRPEPVPKLNPGGEYLARVWGTSVYPLAKRLGVLMRLPSVQPRSRRAHEAAKWAGDQGHFDSYNAALFRAFFERGEDIEQVHVLLDLAAAVGLDVDKLSSAIDSKTFETLVISDEQEASELGLKGVPAFLADRRLALSGVQPLAALEDLVSRARFRKK